MQTDGIVILAGIDWNFLKQRPQHLAEGFARRRLPVLFLENTGVRMPKMRDLPRMWQRLRRNTTAVRGEEAAAGVEVCSPLAIPFPYNPVANAYNLRYLRGKVHKFLQGNALQPQRVALISYLATPLAMGIAEAFPWKRVLYDVLSDPKLVEPCLGPFEADFLRRADWTLFTSATLMEEYGDSPQRGRLFRDGCNWELFEAEGVAAQDLAGLPRPRFLYLGGINRKLWPEPLVALADGNATGSVVLVGPVALGEMHMPARPNLYVLPPRLRYEDLAGLLANADAALIPYRSDRYAGAMHPAKLNEYLVFGLPVVAMRTRELGRLAETWDVPVLYLADTPEDFVAAAARAVAEDTPALREARRSFARRNTWDKRVEELLELLEEAED